ncbi:phytochrome A-associated F-box protein-like [Nymphaea colorata]|nr:phytochrome A-associated F-box protein-like [Nymphaea colorata]
MPAFSDLSDDILLNVFFKLEDDPRHWCRLACVCTRFNVLIRSVCCKTKCSSTIPSIVSNLLHSSSSQLITLFPPASADCDGGGDTIQEIRTEPPGWWSSLQKVNVCCPGLHHAGVLLDSCDFGLERAIGSDHNYAVVQSKPYGSKQSERSSDSASSSCSSGGSKCWSLFDDLLFDTIYDESECSDMNDGSCKSSLIQSDRSSKLEGKVAGFDDSEISKCDLKRRKKFRSVDAHLASGVWNLSREQGSKLLASRFRGDCLYICDWPGCEHAEERRNYKLFRGVFKNFKRSRVWRSINDSKAKKVGLNCAFCSCEGTWDLLSCFCLRRQWEYHEDGEPVVRAYVCENGHVSGAWTDKPLYT